MGSQGVAEPRLAEEQHSSLTTFCCERGFFFCTVFPLLPSVGWLSFRPDLSLMGLYEVNDLEGLSSICGRSITQHFYLSNDMKNQPHQRNVLLHSTENI
jgi:hypothetical protein